MPTVAFKVQISEPTFGEDFSGHDNSDFSDREPTNTEDGDHHATIPQAEVDPLELTDEELAALNLVLCKINRQTVKITDAGPMGVRFVLLPSDGRR